MAGGPCRVRAALPGLTGWNVPSALEMMDRQGIATAVLSMAFWSGLFADADDVAAARRLTRSFNEQLAEVIRSHPDRFGGFACLPPARRGRRTGRDRLCTGNARELDGVILLTNANGVYLGDSRPDPVFDELNRRRTVVFLHPTLPACADCTSLGCSR
ncbi:MAG TPA: amidohydrolase family protein [Trebonia sp.]|nr:amidohydrolase family protein [Trebonia sp.]